MRQRLHVSEFSPIHTPAFPLPIPCDCVRVFCCLGYCLCCQDNNYQFDCVRRARYSTTMVLHHVLHPDVPVKTFLCNGCGVSIHDAQAAPRWHCDVDTCDFDVCDECYKQRRVTHEHALTARGVVVDAPPSLPH